MTYDRIATDAILEAERLSLVNADLLLALRRIEALIEPYATNDRGEPIGANGAALNIARAAIVKAEPKL